MKKNKKALRAGAKAALLLAGAATLFGACEMNPNIHKGVPPATWTAEDEAEFDLWWESCGKPEKDKDHYRDMFLGNHVPREIWNEERMVTSWIDQQGYAARIKEYSPAADSVAMTVLEVAREGTGGIAPDIPDYALRNPGFIHRWRRCATIGIDGTDRKFKITYSPSDMQFYLFKPGVKMTVKKNFARKASVQSPTQFTWDDIDTINGTPAMAMVAPRGWASSSQNEEKYVPPNDSARVQAPGYDSIGKIVGARVCRVEDVGNNRWFYLDLDGSADGFYIPPYDSRSGSGQTREVWDRVLEVSSFWPTHRDVYETLKVGDRVELDAEDIFLVPFAPGRVYCYGSATPNIKLPEYDLLSYAGKPFDRGAIYDFIHGEPTLNKYNAARTPPPQASDAITIVSQQLAGGR